MRGELIFSSNNSAKLSDEELLDNRLEQLELMIEGVFRCPDCLNSSDRFVYW